jgi:hypothetical protein
MCYSRQDAIIAHFQTWLKDVMTTPRLIRMVVLVLSKSNQPGNSAKDFIEIDAMYIWRSFETEALSFHRFSWKKLRGSIHTAPIGYSIFESRAASVKLGLSPDRNNKEVVFSYVVASNIQRLQLGKFLRSEIVETSFIKGSHTSVEINASLILLRTRLSTFPLLWSSK